MSALHRVAFVLSLIFTAILATPLLHAEEDSEKGWTTLFDGKDLKGWRFQLGKEGAKNDGTFTVKDGVLICSGKPSGYIYTEKSYSRYTLQFELAFKRPEDLKSDSDFRGNSGCLIHVAKKNALGVWPRSVEVQGMNRSLGLILPIPRSLKCTRTFDAKASEKACKPIGQFNKMEIEVKGGDMVIRLNGAVVSTVGECELTEGPIGFQSEGAETHWKNIRIRENDAWVAYRPDYKTNPRKQRPPIRLVSNPAQIEILSAPETPRMEPAWGKPVEGVQSRLRPGVFRNRQWLTFDLRNDSSNLSVQLSPGGVPREILVDNVAYRWSGRIAGAAPVCKPGQHVAGAKFKLDKNWTAIKSVGGPETLELKLGKHTVQAIVHAGAKDAKPRGPVAQVLSNPVEITIKRALPGSRLSIDKAIEGEAAFAAVCEAVGRPRLTTTPSPRIDPYNTRWQEFKVIEVLFGKAQAVDRIHFAYKEYGKERSVQNHERVIWIGRTRNTSPHGSLYGLKALPDTPENRQAVKPAPSAEEDQPGVGNGAPDADDPNAVAAPPANDLCM